MVERRSPKLYIAFFIPELNVGGAEKVIISLVNGLSSKGHQVDLVLVNKRGELIKKVNTKARIINLQSKKTLMSVRPLRRYLLRNSPDILLSALDNANIVASQALKDKQIYTKHIISFHTNLEKSYQNTRHFFQKAYPFFMRRLYKNAEGYVAVSKCTGRKAVKYLNLNKNKMRIIYNPIISEELKIKSKALVEHKWINKSDVKLIIAVGRIFEAKDYPTLLKAFNIVSNVESKARLLIIGKGNEKIVQGLKQYIKYNDLENKVELFGESANPYPYILNSSLLVMSSKWEGFGNVIAESLYLNTPVVSTNCECGPSEILKEGKYGRLTEPENSLSLANALLLEIKNPLLINGNEKNKHLEKMTIKEVVERYENYFNEICKNDK